MCESDCMGPRKITEESISLHKHLRHLAHSHDLVTGASLLGFLVPRDRLIYPHCRREKRPPSRKAVEYTSAARLAWFGQRLRKQPPENIRQSQPSASTDAACLRRQERNNAKSNYNYWCRTW